MKKEELKAEYRKQGCSLSTAVSMIKQGMIRGSLSCEFHGFHSIYDIVKQPERYFR